jgi:hypothetical protein
MRSVQPRHIRFAAGSDGDEAGHAPFPSQLGKPEGTKARRHESQNSARKHAPAPDPARTPEPVEESPFELLGEALINSRIISRALGSILESHNRAGDFITARGAALRLADCLTKLLDAEEPVA